MTETFLRMFRPAARVFTCKVTKIRCSSRQMTEEDWAHYHRAFDRLDEAFAEIRKIKP